MIRTYLGAALVAVSIVAILPSVSVAQPGGRGGFRGGPGGMMGGDGIIGLLQRDEVRQELQLVDDQQEQLQAIADEVRGQVRDEMRGLFEQMRDLGEEERRAKFQEIRDRMEEVRTDVEGRIQKVLLPHQFERLKQIDVQARIQRQGASALTGGELAKALNLTDEQQQKIRERSEEVQRELDEQIRQLRLEARNKLLEVLTPEQRAKLDSLTGEQFSLPDQGFRGRDRFRNRRGQERGND